MTKMSDISQLSASLYGAAMDLDSRTTPAIGAQWQTAALTKIEESATLETLDEWRVEFLGKLGVISQLLKTLGGLPSDIRNEKSRVYNGLREAVTSAIAAKKDQLETAILNQRLETERLDMTLPAPERPSGTIHPVSQVMDELAEIFADMGFAVAEGPEIEDDWHNFSALNIPETHPARAMHDTFYFPDQMARDGKKMLLRTHTSPVQIRTMTSQEPPIRIIAPGRVYRSDSDATHTPMFHQIEGLVIDKGIHLGHLKWTLETFLKAYFERDDVVLRLRPSYFPFTEPSVEVDVGYSVVNGKRVIGGSEGWMEVLGSGMVHRKVIEACGLDPAIWQGFAFGTGVDRLAMLKYGMDDLRAFFDGDNRWLNHYGFSALDVPTLSGGVGA
jgi:phenylalanyl-tRNA synthetase alpha chain